MRRSLYLTIYVISNHQLVFADIEIQSLLKLEQLFASDEYAEIKDDSVADLIYEHLNISADKMETFKKRRKKGEPINMRKEFQFVSDEDLAASKNEGIAVGQAKEKEEIVKNDSAELQ